MVGCKRGCCCASVQGAGGYCRRTWATDSSKESGSAPFSLTIFLRAVNILLLLDNKTCAQQTTATVMLAAARTLFKHAGEGESLPQLHHTASVSTDAYVKCCKVPGSQLPQGTQWLRWPAFTPAAPEATPVNGLKEGDQVQCWSLKLGRACGRGMAGRSRLGIAVCWPSETFVSRDCWGG